MVNGLEMVVAWIDERKRLLDLIEAKVRADGRMSLIVERCKHWDRMLREQVAAESLRVKADGEVEEKSGGSLCSLVLRAEFPAAEIPPR